MGPNVSDHGVAREIDGSMDAMLNLSRCRGSLLPLTVFNDVHVLTGHVRRKFKLSSSALIEALKLCHSTCTAAGCLPALRDFIGHVALR